MAHLHYMKKLGKKSLKVDKKWRDLQIIYNLYVRKSANNYGKKEAGRDHPLYWHQAISRISSRTEPPIAGVLGI